MAKVLSTHTEQVRVEDWDSDITGSVLFINGKLAMVLRSHLVGHGRTALVKALYYKHLVTCYQLISNKG